MFALDRDSETDHAVNGAVTNLAVMKEKTGNAQSIASGPKDGKQGKNNRKLPRPRQKQFRQTLERRFQLRQIGQQAGALTR